MEAEIPYIIFQTKRGKFAIDAYLVTRIEKLERVATLIRKAESVEKISTPPQIAKDFEREFEEFLERLMRITRSRAGRLMNKRLGKMRRWNIFRFLGIPTGHSRHISEEERLAKDNREALLALSILENVISENIEVIGYGTAKVEIKGKAVYLNGKLDPVYTELLKTDMRAALALLELVK
ncbi:hypothetical protein A3L04_06595 [Thermococcus chitonophagus]|uniref:Uncharacterized protein n=1 Tax=Thermococcus chitonophagus TaxID=54262 RepID=A0A160VUF3_9EURY|nr:hypothetical protein [Thermococcus chitonophagus]ASJ16765.1 hypothetical protein A3L04_06595 [Thermococcus chitonophagus]CUX78236.1 hypothetical protein CHITON_1457 [Thermococcus chitonophagus]